MSERLNEPNKSQTDEHRDKYFSVQIKAWTNFDPMDKSLAKIAEAINRVEDFLRWWKF